MNESIIKLLQDRYFLSNEKSWDDIARRVSEIYPPIYEYIKDMKFIPGTPTLINANTKGARIGTLSSCFPMGIEDSIDGIMESAKECAQVTKMGGGVGYDFSILRGSSENIESIQRNSSGPLPFINIFNSILDGIQQGGVRRGAGMALLSIHHPNILDFIEAKSDITKFTRFNFSIKISNKFYNDLEKRPDFTHRVEDKNGDLFNLRDKNNNIVTVKQLWDLIIEKAWKSAEPGIFNEDIAFNQCTHTNLDKRVLSNPCAEHISIQYSSCNLGSINLQKFVEDKKFDWKNYKKVIQLSTRYLNNIINNNNFAIDKIKHTTLKINPIGLGTMGLAHALYEMEIPYNSEKAIKFCEELYMYTTLCSMQESILIAKENKKSYEAFDFDLYIKANKRFFKKKKCREIDIDNLISELQNYGVYNATQTSIAPTGSISFIAETSSGIEPVFALSYSRRIEKLNKEYDIVYISDPIFEKYLNNNFDDKTKEKILKQVIENNGSCQKCSEIPDDIKKVFVIASDLTPIEHLDILEKICKGTSMSVSKTINMPKNSTKEEVSEVYLEAYKRECIGVTIYREGSREGILILNDNKNIVERDAPKRPKKLHCHIYTITVQGEKWKVFVGLYNGYPYEVFSGKIDLVDIPSSIEEGSLTKIKSKLYQFEHNGEVLIKDITKLFTSGVEEALTRQISTNLRHGTPIPFIIDQLEKSNGTLVDFNKSIIRALKKYLKDGTVSSMICPECGNKLIFFDGCKKCPDPECTVQFCG